MDNKRIEKRQLSTNEQAPPYIKAEQILAQTVKKQPRKRLKQDIRDNEELKDHQFRQRRLLEQAIQKNRYRTATWLNYAKFEEQQQDWARCRSVYERALAVNDRVERVWLAYADMEIRQGFMNHARNIYERVTKLLPRVDIFWIKYAYLEEKDDNYRLGMSIYERWMKHQPSQAGYMEYIKFLRKHKMAARRIRPVFYDMCRSHPMPSSFLHWAQFEEDATEIGNARAVFGLGIDYLSSAGLESSLALVLQFANFEVRRNEIERARVLFGLLREHVEQQSFANDVFEDMIKFERQFGTTHGHQVALVVTRRLHYEKLVLQNPQDWDIWFSYIKLQQSQSEVKALRNVYEKAISNKPTRNIKDDWRRYIYLWISYALFEEEQVQMDNCRLVYQRALEIVPHKLFTFSKLWVLAAKFEIRQQQLTSARKLLGRGLGLCPKPKLFREYIELELQLKEFDRVRILYQKYILFDASSSQAWTQYAQIEAVLGEEERCRAIFEMALTMQQLDDSEYVWNCYLDFEKQFGYDQNALQLHRRQIMQNSAEAWYYFAQFQYEHVNRNAARQVFQDGFESLRENPSSRLLLLNLWIQFESDDQEYVEQLLSKLPKEVTRTRSLSSNDGSTVTQQYVDLEFPTDTQDRGSIMTMLAQARRQKDQ